MIEGESPVATIERAIARMDVVLDHIEAGKTFAPCCPNPFFGTAKWICTTHGKTNHVMGFGASVFCMACYPLLADRLAKSG